MSGQSRVAVIAALPREIAGLVRGVRPDPALLRQGVHLYRAPEAVCVTAGMGATRVSLAVSAALAEEAVELLLSVGLAGGCMPSVAAGSVLEAAAVLDVRTGERHGTALTQDGPLLVTTDAIAGVHEKRRLAATYGAAMVDMEAATVARLAEAHGLHFRAIKGISDPHDFELASLARFAGAQGQFRTGAFALHTALRPHHWRAASRLGRHSNRALAGLQQCVREVLAETRGSRAASKRG